jgi:hypothetical protein
MLTPEQLQTLKTDLYTTRAKQVYAGKTFASHISESNYSVLAEFYNSPTNPGQNIWKPDLKVSDLPPAIVMSAFVGLTAVKQNGYFVLTQGEYVDATNANIRTGFVTIFGAGSATTTNLTALAQRFATNFEFLFTTANVSSVYNYILTEDDIREATQL